MIVGLLVIPGIGGLGFIIFGDDESVFHRGIVLRWVILWRVVIGEIDGGAVLLGNFELSRRAGGSQFAFEYGHSRLARAAELHAEMGGLSDGDGFVGKIQQELVARFVAGFFRVKDSHRRCPIPVAGC